MLPRMDDRRVRLVLGVAVLAISCACGFLPGPPAGQAPPAQPVAPPSAPVVPDLGSLPVPAIAPPPMPGQSLLSSRTPDYASLAAPPPGAVEASGAISQAWAEARTREIHRELLEGVLPAQRARVQGIPFHVVSDRVEPNAAAGCSEQRAPMLMITSAMIMVCAASAEARAYDELAGANALESYAQALLEDLRNGRAVRALDRSLLSGPNASDPRRLARAIHLYDQQVAFILGHELAHHYRGHTGCAEDGATTASAREAEELQRGLANAASPLEQPFEVEADVWGVTSVLERGRTRAGGVWNEEGALLSLEVFRHFGPLAGGGVDVGVFLSTHPPSELRAPVVSQAAAMYRPGQPPLPIPTFDGQGISLDLGGGGPPIRLPIPLPIPPPIR